MPSFFKRLWDFNARSHMTTDRSRVAALVLLIWASFGWNMFGGPKPDQPASQPGGAVSNDSYMGLSGEELWSNNCLRCHNIRPPTMYSDAQWDVIVHHMRLRANITGQEQRAIVEFLKSAK
jgi:hypothetical protein